MNTVRKPVYEPAVSYVESVEAYMFMVRAPGFTERSEIDFRAMFRAILELAGRYSLKCDPVELLCSDGDFEQGYGLWTYCGLVEVPEATQPHVRWQQDSRLRFWRGLPNAGANGRYEGIHGEGFHAEELFHRLDGGGPRLLGY